MWREGGGPGPRKLGGGRSRQHFVPGSFVSKVVILVQAVPWGSHRSTAHWGTAVNLESRCSSGQQKQAVLVEPSAFFSALLNPGGRCPDKTSQYFEMFRETKF